MNVPKFAVSIVLVVLALTMTGVASLLALPVTEQEIKPRKVFAFYYPWYGNPEVAGGSGKRRHWKGIDAAAQDISNSTNYPTLGAYDSHDENLIAQHMTWARQVGVDGFIVSWWGKGKFTDRALGKLLEASKSAGLELAIYYERIRGEKNARSAARQILEVLHRHGDHPAWMRHNGKPVIFVYGRTLNEIGLDAWGEVVHRVNATYPGGAILIGDRQTPRAAKIFGGIHRYAIAGRLKGKGIDELRAWVNATYPKWVGTARRKGRISTVTVMPGYDDTKVRSPGIRLKRFGGKAYRAQWRAAIAAKPDWVLITSWNEWHEGSEIEPSVEYGDAYLEMTAEYAARFKGTSAKK